ncbi:hypothetical protein IQ273_13615 [Nodosilinea sp. LEGE 07298]|nr:hypothetical protein [Nodosilinea sp. LEGE 07298]MBE9110454.1 hypothetical protein [Nodosilinea sp. LEGE 07298]
MVSCSALLVYHSDKERATGGGLDHSLEWIMRSHQHGQAQKKTPRRTP